MLATAYTGMFTAALFVAPQLETTQMHCRMDIISIANSRDENCLTIRMNVTLPLGLEWRNLTNNVEWEKLRNSTFCIMISV